MSRRCRWYEDRVERDPSLELSPAGCIDGGIAQWYPASKLLQQEKVRPASLLFYVTSIARWSNVIGTMYRILIAWWKYIHVHVYPVTVYYYRLLDNGNVISFIPTSLVTTLFFSYHSFIAKKKSISFDEERARMSLFSTIQSASDLMKFWEWDGRDKKFVALWQCCIRDSLVPSQTVSPTWMPIVLSFLYSPDNFISDDRNIRPIFVKLKE